jgi:hypothetical protein
MKNNKKAKRLSQELQLRPADSKFERFRAQGALAIV